MHIYHDSSTDASTLSPLSSSQQTPLLTPDRSAELLIQTLVPDVSKATVRVDEKDITISGDSATITQLAKKLEQVLGSASGLQKVLQSQLPTRYLTGAEDEEWPVMLEAGKCTGEQLFAAILQAAGSESQRVNCFKWRDLSEHGVLVDEIPAGQSVSFYNIVKEQVAYCQQLLRAFARKDFLQMIDRIQHPERWGGVQQSLLVGREVKGSGIVASSSSTSMPKGFFQGRELDILMLVAHDDGSMKITFNYQFVFSNVISPKMRVGDTMIQVNKFDLIQFLRGATGRDYLLQGQTDAKGELTARPIFVGAATDRGREKSITIVLDRSGSMERCYAKVLSALGTIIHELKERYGQGSVNLIAFDETVVKQPLAITDDEKTRTCFEELKKRGVGGSTDLYGALQGCFGSLDSQNKMNVVLVISDGKHTMGGDLTKVTQAMAQAKASGEVPQILFFGVGNEYDHDAADALTKALGAELIPVARDQVDQLASHVIPHFARLFKPMQPFDMILEAIGGGAPSQPSKKTYFVREGEIQAGEAFSAASLVKVTINGQQTIIGYQVKTSAQMTTTSLDARTSSSLVTAASLPESVIATEENKSTVSLSSSSTAAAVRLTEHAEEEEPRNIAGEEAKASAGEEPWVANLRTTLQARGMEPAMIDEIITASRSGASPQVMSSAVSSNVGGGAPGSASRYGLTPLPAATSTSSLREGSPDSLRAAAPTTVKAGGESWWSDLCSIS